MKTDPTRESWYERFLRWAGGEEADGPEGPEDPERQEFQEYLEYIDAHGYLEFGAYRLMRWKERRERILAARRNGPFARKMKAIVEADLPDTVRLLDYTH